MRCNWTEGWPVVYLDETWVNAHDGKNKAWGERHNYWRKNRWSEVCCTVFFICHSSYVTEHHLAKENTLLYYMLMEKMDGFLLLLVQECCDWVFKSKKGSSTDYHQEMNAPNFELWFQMKLIPALPTSTLIEMDNASYHRYPILDDFIYQLNHTKLSYWGTT